MGIEYAKTYEYFMLETEEEKKAWLKALQNEQKDVVARTIEEGDVLEAVTGIGDMMEFYKAYATLLQLIDHLDDHRRGGDQLEGCGLAGPILNLRRLFMTLGRAISEMENEELQMTVQEFLNSTHKG